MDSCAFLAWIKGEPEAAVMQSLFDLIDAGDADLVVSAFIFAEVYKPAGPGEAWQPKMDAVLAKLRSRDVEVVDVTQPVAACAAQLRLAHGLKGMDSIHLASAVKNRCTWFVTKDRKFPSEADGVQVWDIHAMSAEQLPWMSRGVPQQPNLFDAED
nr:type II toxin-antitoxin system VapC family toxin [Cutibacterium avidum]